jgi:heme-degrading monooxygenase HmoA
LFDLVVLLVVWSSLVDFRSWRTEYLIVEITLDAAEVRY